MPVTPWPFVTDGVVGDVPIGFYPAADSDKQIILQPTPGLSTLCTLPSCTEVRGMFPWNNYLYIVARRGSQSVLWRVSPAGAPSELGYFTSSSSGPVWMFNNSTQICIVDGVTAYVFTVATGILVQITDAAFDGSSSGAYQDGYGLFTKPNSQKWFFSSIDDFLTFDALDYYSKEGKPDNIVCIFSDHREPWIFGNKSIEVWYNAGGDNSSSANPTFARNSGGLLEFGCSAAGSVAKWDNSIAWLSDKGQVLRAVGYNAQVISNDMFGREVANYSILSDAIAFSYTDQEHEFYQITFPSADTTWVLDAKTKLWHKKRSFKSDGTFGRHRANCYAFMNNIHYVGDYNNGKIYKMSTDYLDDSGEEIQRVLYSKDMNFGLQRQPFPSVQIDFLPGVGLENGLDPQAMLQYSKDGGSTWSSELWRSVGKIGEYTKRAIWHRMGSDFRRMYRLTVTDPVVWKVWGIYGWGQNG